MDINGADRAMLEKIYVKSENLFLDRDLSDEQFDYKVKIYPDSLHPHSNIIYLQTIYIFSGFLEVVVIFTFAYLSSLYFYPEGLHLGHILSLAIAVVVLAFLGCRIIEAHDPHQLSLRCCRPVEASAALAAAFAGIILLQAAIDPSQAFWQVIWAGASIVVTHAIRQGVWSSGWALTNGAIAILGNKEDAERLRAVIDRPNRCPVKFCLSYDDPASLPKLRGLVEAGVIEGVILVGIPAEQQQTIVSGLADLPIAVFLAPAFGLTRSIDAEIIEVLPNHLSGQNGLAKRGVDLVGATVGLIFLAPLLLAVAAMIKLESPGPVFFRQRRFGLGGHAVEIWKFRTMRADSGDHTGVASTLARDPRVTRLGRLLRRLSIDELPQLLNVLAGTMSLVGPRPHVTRMKVGETLYREAVGDYALRHRVKPGLTGWAQINGSRGVVDTMEKAERRIALDLWYITNWSLALDLRIILRTAFGGFMTFRAD
jgi:exopolysaccharide biosynthesis polyprenyl glycosylphosphotransferase